MAKLKSNAPLKEQSSDEPAIYPVTESSPDEIDRLRDILFGSQTRSLERRLGDLETRLETVRQEMVNLFTEKIDKLTNSTSTQLTSQGKEQSAQLRVVQKEQSDQLRAVQKELSDRLDKQTNEQSVQLRTAQKEANDAVEKLAAELLRQIREAQKQLSDKLDKVDLDQTERTRSLQSETRQRDDGLRQEFLSLVADLESGKTSRQELSQMLMELGLRLQQESENS